MLLPQSTLVAGKEASSGPDPSHQRISVCGRHSSGDGLLGLGCPLFAHLPLQCQNLQVPKRT